MSHVSYYYRQCSVPFGQTVRVVTSFREQRHNTWLAYCASYYAHALILNYLVADMVWYGVSCNQKLFVTLGQVGFQTLYLGQNVTFLEHQIPKILGPQNNSCNGGCCFVANGCENNKACQVVND